MKKILVPVNKNELKSGDQVRIYHSYSFLDGEYINAAESHINYIHINNPLSGYIERKYYDSVRKFTEVSDDVYDLIVSGQSVEDLLNAYELWRSKRKPNGTFGKHIKETVDEYINKK